MLTECYRRSFFPHLHYISRMKYIAILLTALFFAHPAQSCLNLFGEDIHGNTHELNHRIFRTISFKPAEIKANIIILNTKISTGAYTYQDISNYGVWILKAGRYAEGLTLFRELIKTHPDEYQVIQNLGTAYELNGMPDSALLYIKKGFSIYPKSHDGSEWIHILYLEHMLAKKEPGADFIFLEMPAGTDTRQVTASAEQVVEQVNAQLSERVPFTLGKDDMLAKLLVEAGDIYAEKLSVTRAHVYYLHAEHFAASPQLKKILREKIKKVSGVISNNSTKKNYSPLDIVSDIAFPREYEMGLKQARKLSARQPVNTAKWKFLPMETLVTRLENAPKN